tara:strand:- start:957 stop:1193 length:237 start_codon:yes stop_codon:yes gene_type:complete
MAVDTPTKRSSALNIRTRCRRFLPVPDGTISVEDRAHLAGVYYEVASAVQPVDGWIAETNSRVAITETQNRLWIVSAK